MIIVDNNKSLSLFVKQEQQNQVNIEGGGGWQIFHVEARSFSFWIVSKQNFHPS